MVVIVGYREHPVSVAACFLGAGRAVYEYGASNETCRHLRGANPVMWEAIEWLARQGIKTLHLGRTSIGKEGLRRFKLGWGGEEYKMEYFKYDLRNEVFSAEMEATMGMAQLFVRETASWIAPNGWRNAVSALCTT